MKFRTVSDRTHHGVHCSYDILDATEELLASVRRTSMGEKIVVEKHLREMWNDANASEQVVIAAIVNALKIPERT